MAASHTKSDLFQLVKSMTPSEKRHFRLDNPSKKGKEKSEENQFLLLFDILEKQEKEDEKEAMKRLKLKERNRFTRIKNYLYKALLVSLENYYRESPGDAQFFHLVNQTQILISKRLYLQASRQLAKAEKIAVEKGNGIYSLIVLTLKIDRITREELLDQMESLLDDYEADKASLLERSGDYLDLQMIRSKATWLMRRDVESKPKYRVWLEELGSHPLLKEVKYPEDIEFTLYHYNLNGLIHGLLGNPEEDYRNRLAYLTTYQKNPAYIQRWPINYITALGNVAGSAAQTGNFEELLSCTKEMRTFMDREGIKNRSFLDPIVEVRSHALELDAHPVMSASEITSLNNKLERSFQKNEQDMTEIWQIISRHGIARYHFWNQSWDKALEWLNPIVHQSDDRLYPELQWSARLMYVLANFEKRNDRYLSGYLPKLNQWLRINNCQWEPVKILLKEIKGMLFQKPRVYSVDTLAKLASQFSLEPNGNEVQETDRRILEFRQLIHLEPWLNGKLQPVAQRKR